MNVHACIDSRTGKLNGCICITGKDHDETEMDMDPATLATHRANPDRFNDEDED